jgi:hypothetical protein
MDLLIEESEDNGNFTHDEMRDEVSSMMAGVIIQFSFKSEN